MLEESPDSRELQEEKRKDYRNVVAAQGILLAVSLFTDPLVSSAAAFHLFTLCCVIYLGLLWDLSRNFTLKRWLPRLLGSVALGVIVFSVLYNYFFWTPRWGVPVNAALHGATISMQAVVLWLGLRDLLRGPRNAVDKLWAAAGIYLMLGIAFGETIHFFDLIAPDTIGGIAADVQGFHEALYLSFVALTGADNAVSSISHFCRNLMLVESLLSQLFLVMLISRLLLPAEEAASR